MKYDAIVIGGGQAGPSLAARFDAVGKKVAVIERKLIGGTCVNTGCMPTKTLVASARAAHVVRRAKDFGVHFDGNITVDMKRVKERAETVTKNARAGLEKWIAGMKNVTFIEGHARFESATTVRVGDQVLEAEQIFINVGGRARVPALSGLEEISYLTNTSIVALDVLPRHLVVVGGSYIGLEFAQMYRRFGSEVTILEKGPRLVVREDEEISEAIQKILEGEGIKVLTGAECMSFAPGQDASHIEVTAGGSRKFDASHVLLAVGREPNTDDLGLDKAGVTVDKRGYVVVDDQLRTNVPGIWAMGDCNGRGAFTHTSYNDYEIVAANIFDSDPRRVSDRIEAYNLYIDPPLGRAGMTEADARKTGKKLLIGHRPMTRVGRANERDENLGFMKVVVDADTKKILGAAILGIEGDEVIHGLLGQMYANQPYTTLQRSVGIHPTVSELVPTMLGDLKPAI